MWTLGKSDHIQMIQILPQIFCILDKQFFTECKIANHWRTVSSRDVYLQAGNHGYSFWASNRRIHTWQHCTLHSIISVWTKAYPQLGTGSGGSAWGPWTSTNCTILPKEVKHINNLLMSTISSSHTTWLEVLEQPFTKCPTLCTSLPPASLCCTDRVLAISSLQSTIYQLSLQGRP